MRMRSFLAVAELLDTMKGVVAGLPEEQRGLTVLVVDTFTLTLLDATVGLAAVVDTGFLGEGCATVAYVVRSLQASRGLATHIDVTCIGNRYVHSSVVLD